MDEAAPYIAGTIFTLGGLLVLWVGWTKWRKYRLILDTPTSKIRSMAIGIVEIHGQVVAETLIRTPFSKTDCVFYKYEIKEYRRHTTGSGKNRRTTYRWETVSSGDQRVLFLAKDDTGTVLVNPEGAEFNVARRRVFYQKAGGFGSIGGLVGFIKRLKDFSLSSENEFDTTEWKLEEITADSGWSFGTSVGDRKYYEYFLLPDDNLFVLGTAANQPDAPNKVLIKQSTNEKMFYISDSSEKGIVKSLKKAAFASVGGGLFLFVAGLVMLAYFSELI